MRHLAATAFMAAEFGACVAVFTPIMGASWLAHRGDPTQRAPGRWMRRLGRTIATLSPLWDAAFASVLTEPELLQPAIDYRRPLEPHLEPHEARRGFGGQSFEHEPAATGPNLEFDGRRGRMEELTRIHTLAFGKARR